jgi:hypothetical protein
VANFEPLLQRNRHFATTGAYRAASIVATHQVYVITCLDPRTDPSAFLELQLGDAMVIRNAGGRVSPDVLKDLAYIGYLARTINPRWRSVRGCRHPSQPVRHAFPRRPRVPPRFRRDHRRRRCRTCRASSNRSRGNRPLRRSAPTLGHRTPGHDHRVRPRLRRHYRPRQNHCPGRSRAPSSRKSCRRSA